jgi:hypothetical protein
MSDYGFLGGTEVNAKILVTFQKKLHATSQGML